MIDQEAIRQYFSTQPVLRAWLFGSYADGTADEQSDVDILVELDHTKPVGLRLVKMWEELRQMLGKEVDLLSTGGVSKHLLPYVQQQKQLIYERKIG